MTKSSYPLIRLKERAQLATLHSLGVATEYFQAYRNIKQSFHTLDVTLISVIINGECRHLIGGEYLISSESSLGITPQGVTHTIVTGDFGVEVLNIYLDLKRIVLPVLPQPFDTALPLLFPLNSNFRNRLNRVVHVRLAQDDGCIAAARGLHCELTAQNAGYDSIIFDYLRIFLIGACRQLLVTDSDRINSSMGQGDFRLERVRRVLDHDFSKPMALEKLAEVAGLSPNYLCRAFRAWSGKTIFSYLLERRIQAAMLQLRGSSDKISAIAYDCGFNDLSYFNRTFKKFTATTPARYRGKR
ncbi:MAG: AraC family transcriptional regulator [Victivallaceae bacterium]|nr:AraC family transcriptional regulator [Victivallaceae bacterium]